MISRRMRCPLVVHLHLHPHALGHETCWGKHLGIRTGIGFVNLVGERNELCESFRRVDRELGIEASSDRGTVADLLVLIMRNMCSFDAY